MTKSTIKVSTYITEKVETSRLHN